MRFYLLGFWLLALPLFAAETVSFRNDREGESYYAGNSTNRAMNKALRDLAPLEIIEAYRESLALESENLCAYNLNSTLKSKLERLNPRFNEYPGIVHYLRYNNEIDDVVVSILLRAYETQNVRLLLPKRQEDLRLPKSEVVDDILPLLGKFEQEYRLRGCLDDNYKSLYSEMLKVDKNLKRYHLEALYVEAFKQRLVSLETYKVLERARVKELEKTPIGLKQYYQKLKSLRAQYPLRDANEKSDFVTQKVDKQKFSRRQKLLENYTDLQIILMGNVIKSLRARLESPRIEILVYDREEVVETISLEPMERFRFAIKLLRKEIAHLSLNTYFGGRTPDYLDLMTASYEVGIIPASELDEIARLKEIWNPRKSFWEKAGVWIKSFSSVATIALPPPYGFLPALGVVVIEATVGKKTQTGDDSDVLF